MSEDQKPTAARENILGVVANGCGATGPRKDSSCDNPSRPNPRVSSLGPGRIALGYAVIAILWIAFSNAVVVYLKLPPAVQTIKGTVFVFVTASLLYFTIRRLVQAVELTSQ